MFLADPSTANIMKLRTYTDVYHPLPVTDDVSTFAGITSPYAGVDDFRWYFLEISMMLNYSKYDELIGGLTDTLNLFYIGDRGTSFEVPVLFISGSEDWICPVGLIKDYYDEMSSPYKDMYLVEGCGHSPQGQRPEEFANAVKSFLKNT